MVYVLNRGKTPDATNEYTEILPPVQFGSWSRPGTPTPSTPARRACRPTKPRDRQPCLEGLGPHCARGSAATDRPRASAASCAIDSCDATESRCVTKAIHVRADQVVSSYSDAVSLFLRHSAAARSASTSGGDSPPNVAGAHVSYLLP